MNKLAGMSDTALKAKTGKTWDEWLAVLDKAGAQLMEHKAIAQWLHDKQKVDDWWCQMVTVGYEQARGLRQVNQKADGFSASVSKTFGADLEAVFEAFSNSHTRKRWLAGASMEVRKETSDKSMRITWIEPGGAKTNVEINFYAKGDNKAQVSLEHNKLPDAASVDTKKAYWKSAFAKLEEMLLEKAV